VILGRPVGRRRPGGTLVDAIEAARHLDGLGVADPIVLAVLPRVVGNPYQSLLYRRAWDHGIAPIALDSIDQLDELRGLPALGIRSALHLHWLGMVLKGATEDTAGQALAAFLTRVDAFLDVGGRLAWTVHNLLPHDARLPEFEAELRRGIVARCAAIHVMADRTLAAPALMDIPEERVIRVPHPSYRGAYPDLVTRHEARRQLGIATDETVYLMFGAIKPYKGVTVALDAFDELVAASPGRRRLLVGGAPDGAPETIAFLERCRAHPLVSVAAHRIPDGEVQLYLRSADVALLPYRRYLNSGVLMLAVTFGLPVVVPDAEAGVVGPAVARTFAPGLPGSLAAAMRAADDLLEPGARGHATAAARALAERHDPDRLAEDFALQLRQRLDAEPDGAGAPGGRLDAGAARATGA
jgi:beta-1,4-mannosyltransferase